jgi:N-carbamoyl-L-amino-acid hydrolase
VNIERIRTELRAFARIGYRPDGSIDRLAFSRADLRARQVFIHRLGSLGLQTHVDAIGNIFGRLPTSLEPTLPPVLVGSHLDTVPGGGRFDGAAGVVAALEIAAVSREHDLALRRPVEIVSFACEESSRFGRAMLGSGLAAGTWDPEEILSLRDGRGMTLRQVIMHLGLDPARLGTVRRGSGSYSAYLELHIEQGRVLEESGAQLGIVEAIASPTRLKVEIRGRADHSGTTPMPLRRDALAAAAELILAIERTAQTIPRAVATVGIIQVEPNVMNVVPGRVELGIDIRSTEATQKAEVTASVQESIAAIARTRGLHYGVRIISDELPVKLNPLLAKVLERKATDRQVKVLRMASGAGHDAMQMAKICAAGMLLVPSRAGISHNREEWTAIEDVALGTQVLLDAVMWLSQDGAPY